MKGVLLLSTTKFVMHGGEKSGLQPSSENKSFSKLLAALTADMRRSTFKGIRTKAIMS